MLQRLTMKPSGGLRNPFLVTLNLLLGFVLPQDTHSDEWKNSTQNLVSSSYQRSYELDKLLCLTFILQLHLSLQLHLIMVCASIADILNKSFKVFF